MAHISDARLVRREPWTDCRRKYWRALRRDEARTAFGHFRLGLRRLRRCGLRQNVGAGETEQARREDRQSRQTDCGHRRLREVGFAELNSRCGWPPGFYLSRPFSCARARNEVSGLAPRCEITSAAASAPRRADLSSSNPRAIPNRNPAANRSPAPVVSTTRSTG